MINHATVAAFETRECVINLRSFLFLTLTNEKQAIVAIFNKLSMLPIASFKNAGTEMILERFTLTMFHCKRQTWICTTWPSFTLTWLLQNKSCFGQFLSVHFLFWIYNCRKRDSEVSLYCSLKYYWKTNENSTENQSLVTRLLTSQLFLLYNKYLQSHLSRYSYMWLLLLPLVSSSMYST